MRKLAYWFVLGIAALVVTGCASDQPTAQDQQFQKDLADAAAKNPGGTAGSAKGGRGKLPPEVAGKMAPPPAQATAGGTGK